MIRSVLVFLLACISVLRGRSLEKLGLAESVSNPRHLDSKVNDSLGNQGPHLQIPDQFRESVDGLQVFRIYIKNEADRRRFENLGRRVYLDMLHTGCSEVDILVTRPTQEQIQELLKNYALDHEVLIDDVQRKIDIENPAMSEEERELVGRQGHKLTFNHYHPLEDIHDYLDYLSQTYKDLVSTEVIGTTHEGNKLKVLKILGEHPNASTIWIDGGIHAREWISPAVVLYIARELVEYRDNLPPSMKQHNYHLLPVVNPDGYEYSRSNSSSYKRFWRKNLSPGKFCSGVDLNRNYDYQWGGKGTSGIECYQTYRGSAPGSELETKAVTNYLIRQIPKVQGFITFHSYGQYILLPWGYDEELPSDFQDLQKVGDLAAQRIKEATGALYSVGNSASMLYPAAGNSFDWAKANGSIKYTYGVELRDKGRNGFLLPSSEINSCAKDGFEIVRAVAEALEQAPPYSS